MLQIVGGRKGYQVGKRLPFPLRGYDGQVFEGEEIFDDCLERFRVLQRPSSMDSGIGLSLPFQTNILLVFHKGYQGNHPKP
jgi:hypothetical protein